MASVKISKCLQWLTPYLERLKKTLPDVREPKSIKSYTHPRKPKQGSMGLCCRTDKSITLALSYHRAGYIGMYRAQGPLDKVALLDTLAHEIAHLHVWDHNPEHSGLTKAIFEAFGVGEECPTCLGAGRICNLKD